MFRVILRERKRREIDPALNILHESMADLQDESGDRHVKERLNEMLEFFEVITTIYDQMEQLPTGTLRRLARLGENFSRLMNLVSLAEKENV
jgi:DNA-binding transcriptional regulator GbsR (MarR family)